MRVITIHIVVELEARISKVETAGLNQSKATKIIKEVVLFLAAYRINIIER